jgi:hypothetical protein
MNKEALKLALEALKTLVERFDYEQFTSVCELDDAKDAIKALEEALKQEQGVPEINFGNIKQEQGELEKEIQTEFRRLKKVERKYKKALSFGTVLTFEAWGGRYKKKELSGAKYDEWLEDLITPKKKAIQAIKGEQNEK